MVSRAIQILWQVQTFSPKLNFRVAKEKKKSNWGGVGQGHVAVPSELWGIRGTIAPHPFFVGYKWNLLLQKALDYCLGLLLVPPDYQSFLRPWSEERQLNTFYQGNSLRGIDNFLGAVQSIVQVRYVEGHGQYFKIFSLFQLKSIK